MTLSQATAVQGTQITVSPTGTAALPVDNSYVHVTTTPSATVTYNNSAWNFNMPNNNTTVNGVFKQDPTLQYSSNSAYAYIDNTEHNVIPVLSYTQGYDGRVSLEAQNSEYAGDIVFNESIPTIPDNTSAYAYIYDGNTVTARIVAYSYANDEYYPNYAYYDCTFGLYNS